MAAHTFEAMLAMANQTSYLISAPAQLPLDAQSESVNVINSRGRNPISANRTTISQFECKDDN